MRLEYDGRVAVLDDNPALNDKILELRDKNTKDREFRRILREIGGHMAVAMSPYLPTREQKVISGMNEDAVAKVPKELYIVEISAAGIPFGEGFLDIYRRPHGAIVGAARNETTLEPETGYVRFPNSFEGYHVAVVDPMNATGGTAADNWIRAYKNGADFVISVAVVSAPEGIEKLLDAKVELQPHQKLPEDLGIPRHFTYAVDKCLNEKGYIIGPGLGDAGNRCYGTTNHNK